MWKGVMSEKYLRSPDSVDRQIDREKAIHPNIFMEN